MRLPVLLLVGLVALSGCTTAGRTVDALPSTTPSPASSTSISADSEPVPELQFVFDDEVYMGDAVRLRLRNVGERAYIYRTTYAACELTYTDADGREFLIPPGTHCDQVSRATIKPGHTVSLFAWRLNECVKDRWGCVRSRPLPPGDYTITGQFSPVGKGAAVDVVASFLVVAA